MKKQPHVESLLPTSDVTNADHRNSSTCKAVLDLLSPVLEGTN